MESWERISIAMVDVIGDQNAVKLGYVLWTLVL